MPQNFPPIVPGVTQMPGGEQPDPFALILKAMSARPEQGQQLIQQGLALFNQAARVDPRLVPIVEAVQRVVVRGPSQAEGTQAGQPGQPMIVGPVSGPPSNMPNRGPM